MLLLDCSQPFDFLSKPMAYEILIQKQDSQTLSIKPERIVSLIRRDIMSELQRLRPFKNKRDQLDYNLILQVEAGMMMQADTKCAFTIDIFGRFKRDISVTMSYVIWALKSIRKLQWFHSVCIYADRYRLFHYWNIPQQL